MDTSNGWITVVAALIASFGGAPLFKYLAERAKGSASIKQSERQQFDAERMQFRQEREAFWAEQRKQAQSERLEAKTLRDAYNDVINRNGRLEGQLSSALQRIVELEAEVSRLRGGNGHKA